MNEEFQIGIVVWYNCEKRYGFARDSWGQQIFFHLNDGRHCYVNDRKLVLFSRSRADYGEYCQVPEPVAEDVIIFKRAKGSKGRDKASPWTFRYMEVDAWLDYEQDQIPCSFCIDPIGQHDGDGKCTVPGCHCGDEDYEETEPQQVWFTESPCGHNGWE